MTVAVAAATTGLPPHSPAFARVRLTEAFPDLVRPVADWRTWCPTKLRVAPQPDLPLDFTRVASRDDGRVVTWVGRISGFPGASFVAVSTAKGMDAVLVIPGASQFNFHVRGDTVVIEESAPGEEGCGVDPAQPDRPSPIVSGNALYRASVASQVQAASTAEETKAAGTAPNVDVLFLYDTDSLNYASARSTDPVGYLEGRSRATIESCNLVLEQSGVTAFVWRWVGLEASRAYTRTNVLIDDLRQVSPGGAIGDFVQDLRYRYGTDQVMLLIGGDTDAGGWANIAARQVPVSGQFACTVMRVSGSYKLMAHELAHNFGCRHDRANFGGTGVSTPEGDGFWCYGLLWTDPITTGGSTTTSGTVMSYANYIVPYFSNPNITLEVTSAMEGRGGANVALGTHTIGFPESHARAANNVRVLNDNASAIVTVNTELSPPVIRLQPQGGTFATGATMSMSVTADGGGLSYQWLRNGQEIAGAVAANYSKTSLTSADAGDYTVRVSNRVGSATSSNASVAVNSAPAPAPTPASGSSGGGGAPSAGFIVIVALLIGRAAARRWPC